MAAGANATKGLLGAAGPLAAKAKALQGKGQANAQNKLQGADFGRNGALARGQGFSGRDTFQAAAAKKSQPLLQRRVQESPQQRAQENPKQQHTPANPQQQRGPVDPDLQPAHSTPQQRQQRAQSNPQSQQKQQPPRAQQDEQAELLRQIHEIQQEGVQAYAMRVLGQHEDEMKKKLKEMAKRCLDWLKQMDAIFLKPAPR